MSSEAESRSLRFTLLVPALNEIDGMRAIMPRIRREWVDQILVVDGKSTDGTPDWARAQGYDVVVQEKAGLRQGYMAALPYIIGDAVITFSPDGNSIPELIPTLVAKMREGYDMVIVSRYLQKARSEDDDLVTAFGNWMFTKLINWVHGSHYTDSTVMFRAYRIRLIRNLELDRDEGYQPMERLLFTQTSWEWLISIRAARCGLRCAEIPGNEPRRIGGKRKLQPIRWGLFMLWQLFREKLVAPPKAYQRTGPSTSS